MKKTLKGLRNLEELFTEQGMAGLDYLSMSIGYDGKAYFLFSSKIPDRIDGMFVNTVANAEYKALVVSPSWECGELKKVERINFGRHVMNFRFLRPVPDGSFLLLGSRCMYSKKNGPEKNAVFIDREGNVLRAFTFGDGIADCIVRDDGLSGMTGSLSQVISMKVCLETTAGTTPSAAAACAGGQRMEGTSGVAKEIYWTAMR